MYWSTWKIFCKLLKYLIQIPKVFDDSLIGTKNTKLQTKMRRIKIENGRKNKRV